MQVLNGFDDAVGSGVPLRFGPKESEASHRFRVGSKHARARLQVSGWSSADVCTDVMAKDNDNLTTLALLPNITRIAKRFEVSYNERITEVRRVKQRCPLDRGLLEVTGKSSSLVS